MSCFSFLFSKTHTNKNNPTYFIIIIVAFTQGVLGLADLSINYLYKDDFKLTPAQVSICTGLTSLPWIIKPLWGSISDSFHFFGYRRKSYLIFFGFLECFCWSSLASWVQKPYQGLLILVIVQIAVAFCNVIGEALLVEVSRGDGEDKNESESHKQGEASKNVSLFFGIRSFGVFLTAYTGGLLLEYFNKKTIFAITAFFPALLACGAFRLQELPYLKESAEEENKKLIKKDSVIEKKVDDSENSSNTKKIWGFIKKPEIYKPILFIFFFMMTPSAGSSMFYFYTNELKFHPNFMGQLKLIHALANMIGIYCYHKFLKQIPFKKIFAWSTVICTITGLTQVILVTRTNLILGIPDKFFSIGDSLIIQTFAEINTIPLLVLACRLCPKNIEGTMYALIMSTLNFGSMLSFQFGGILMYFLGITENNFGNLWILIVLANSLMLLPLPFIVLVDFEIKEEGHAKLKENDENKNNHHEESPKGKSGVLEIKYNGMDDANVYKVERNDEAISLRKSNDINE